MKALKKIIRILKKTVIILAVLLGLFVALGLYVSVFHEDELVAYFIEQANKTLTTPVEAEKIDVSAFRYFPNISINFYKVSIKESYKGSNASLARALEIGVKFNLFDILRKKYTIKGIHIDNADVNLKINEKGEPNYLFIKKDSTAKGVDIELESLTGSNINISYLDEKNGVMVSIHANTFDSGIKSKKNILDINLQGELLSKEINVRGDKYFREKSLKVNTSILVDRNTLTYSFKNGILEIDRGTFLVNGEVKAKENYIDLLVDGKNTSFQTINSLLPNELSKNLLKYKSKGDLYFAGRVTGYYGAGKTPGVAINFGARNASFFHPDYSKAIENISVEGTFTNGSLQKSETFELNLKNFSCMLDDKQLTGNLLLKNFKRYFMALDLKGGLDVNTLLMLMPEKYVKAAFGNIDVDIHAEGYIHHLKNERRRMQFKTNGEVVIRNLSFILTGEKLPFNKFNGSLMLKNQDLAVSNLSGLVGQSDFVLNGFFKDFANTIFANRRKINIQADFSSDYIDFDELLRSNFASVDTTKSLANKYTFNISPKLFMDFNCDIRKLKFRRFYGRNISGNLKVNNQIAVLKNIRVNTMGGSIKASGSVNNKNQNLVEILVDGDLDQINIDSAFYVFYNFKQDWLVDRHLRGQVRADVNLYLQLDQHLKWDSKSLVANINTVISNGELLNFEPMQKLSKFVEEKSLAHMTFSEMRNEISIKDRTIHIPEMEISSNISNILVYGTHTFDQHIDYHLTVPLKSFITIVKKKGYEPNARRGMNLLLKITGTTSDYKIGYDTKALTNKIKDDILDEGKEWREIFDKKENEHEETIELEEEEYFDFEDN